MADPTYEFDRKVLELLGTIPDCGVYEWAVENTTEPRYIVFTGMVEQGVLPYTGRESICGPQTEWYDHPFFIDVIADSPSLCMATIGQIKSLLIGATLMPGSNPIRVSPSAQARPAADGTLRPAKYRMMLMFITQLDRGAS